MPNIFDGIREMKDDEVRLEIALLRTVNFGNVIKSSGNRAIGGLVKFANLFTTMASEKAKIDYTVVSVRDMVTESLDMLKNTDRPILNELLKKEIVIKLEEIDSSYVKDNLNAASDDKVSNLVLKEALKTYALEKNMTPANKAEWIHNRYEEAMFNRLHKQLVNEEADSIRVTDNNLQQELNNVSMEAKRNLHTKIMPKEFSGRGIGRILRLEKNTKYLREVVNVLGMNFYDEVMLNIYTIYDTIFGVNRLQRVLLCQLIYKCVEAYGKFTLNTSMLPDYVSKERSEALKEEEDIYFNNIRNKVELEGKISTYSEEIEKLYQDLINEQDKLDDMEPEDVLIDKQKIKILTLEEKLAGFREDLEKFQSEYNTVSKETVEKIQEKSQQLRLLWIAFFYKFKFADEIFEQVVVNFRKIEILMLEEYLKEMHDSIDSDAYGEPSENTLFFICNVGGRKNARVEFSRKEINKIEVH